MYLDPTLYGATLPQREIPFQTPFINPFFGPMHQVPWQGTQLPWQGTQMPWQGTQMPWQGTQMPWQGPQKHVLPQGVSPYFNLNYNTPFGFQQPYMHTQYAPPVGFNPFFQGGLPGHQFYNWQRPY